MSIPWDVFFALFISLAAVLFAAAGAMNLLNKFPRWHLCVALSALSSMVLSILFGVIFLGHPERIFGAFANPTSVLSHELIAVFAGVVIMGVYVYRAWRQGAVPRIFCGIAVVVGVVLLATTIQLIRVWTKAVSPMDSWLAQGVRMFACMPLLAKWMSY